MKYLVRVRQNHTIPGGIMVEKNRIYLLPRAECEYLINRGVAVWDVVPPPVEQALPKRPASVSLAKDNARRKKTFRREEVDAIGSDKRKPEKPEKEKPKGGDE
jgi:hypothetical protein